MADDRVNDVIEAFLDLEHAGAEPSLDHLTEAERAEVTEVIALIKDTRGVDFFQEPPARSG